MSFIPRASQVSHLSRITGVVLADHVKSLDWEARRVVFEAKATGDVLAEVRARLRALPDL